MNTASMLSHRPWPAPNKSWFMRMSWHDLLFMHWPVAADQLSAHLPDGLTLDLFDGQAWIGIVPFRMSGVAPRWFPDLPGISRFPELNVRTYVTIDGKPGVWFFSLDATNPIAVRTARSLFHLPYMDATIELARDGDVDHDDEWIRYRSHRTHRGEPAADLKVDYRPVGEAQHTEPGTLEHFLTARYCLYSANAAGQVYRGEIAHSPWQLRAAEAVTHTNTMCDGLNVDLPNQPPLLHFAESTDVIAWLIKKV